MRWIEDWLLRARRKIRSAQKAAAGDLNLASPRAAGFSCTPETHGATYRVCE